MRILLALWVLGWLFAWEAAHNWVVEKHRELDRATRQLKLAVDDWIVVAAQYGQSMHELIDAFAAAQRQIQVYAHGFEYGQLRGSRLEGFQSGHLDWSADVQIEMHRRFYMDDIIADDGPVVPVHLDACWRCFERIPKDDELGLCDRCRKELKEL